MDASTEDKVAFFRRWGYLSVHNVLEGEASVNTQKAFTKHTKQLRDAWLAGKAGVPRRYFDLENFVELDRLFLDLGTRPSLYACAEAEAPTKFERLREEETKLPLKRRPTDWDAHCRSRQPGAIYSCSWIPVWRRSIWIFGSDKQIQGRSHGTLDTWHMGKLNIL